MKDLKDLSFKMGIITTQDLRAYTTLELLMKIVNKMNELVLSNNAFYEEIRMQVVELKEQLDYLLGEGLEEEVYKRLSIWLNDGTLEKLINQTALKGISERVTELEKEPDGRILNFQRIGRKLVNGENQGATTYNPLGKACMMQGGCMIDDDTIVYMLWDNMNVNLNKNKLVIMNLQTGHIIKEKDFEYGWCNSIAYHDNLIYVAERGRTNGGVSTNNGNIHVLNINTLEEVDMFVLPINANAISIHDNILYVLKEGGDLVYTYDLFGNPQGESIYLRTNIMGLYNQNIYVDDDFIILLSSRPTNAINVFKHDGKLIKTFNIPKHGGLYFIGEPQFIDKLADGNLVMGSSAIYFNECVNQFFKFNLKNDMIVELPIINYAETIYVNSEVDYYNPSGFIGNEYTTINEMSNINLRNVIVNGNNKPYKYTYISDNEKYMRVINSTFNEGCFAQYGHVNFTDCTFEKSINTSDESPLRIRDLDSVLQNCTFNANGQKYALNVVRNSNVKLVRPVFNGYVTDAIGNVGSGNTINFNSYNSIPFVNHCNVKEYNLHTNGYVSQFKPGTYGYNTSLTSEQIQKIMDNCYRVRIIYMPFNNTTKVVELVKNSSQTYSFVDTTISTTSINMRTCKTQLTLTSSGFTIDSNVTTRFSSNTWENLDASTDNVSENFINIRAIEFVAL